MIDLLTEWALFAPAVISIMLGGFWLPYISKKEKSVKKRAIEAATLAGLISFLCYTLFAVHDFAFPDFTFEARMKKAIGVSLMVMLGTWAIVSVTPNEESQS